MTTRITIRQRQVLRLVSEGKSKDMIGAELGISRNSVKTHMAEAFRRLGVNTAAHAVRRCFERGIFTVETDSHGHTPTSPVLPNLRGSVHDPRAQVARNRAT